MILLKKNRLDFSALDFTKDGQSEIYLNGTVHNFAVDHGSIKKEDILIFTNI